MYFSKGAKISVLIIGLLIIDQVIKFLIKTNMTLGENIAIFGSWAQIYFIENNGMAFGMQFGGSLGKLFLSLLRLLLIGGIIYYLYQLIKSSAPKGVIIGVALILVGAMGNIFDSLFYGLIFSESSYNQVAILFPDSGGYAPFLYGKVVDMFYFPLIDTTLPDWVPFKGGERFIFFRPIFNFADSCITIGVIYLILFQRKFFKSQK